ncbi:unnamed protein product [Owenia fusiformis]|uniref:Uncharacterized protein n=1 Tax=Owenia fusiformis TaxID=6347 RepID=A0A8S4NM27_OWEFU|nr:unnamed protein product [Owenia fusiformis]
MQLPSIFMDNMETMEGINIEMKSHRRRRRGKGKKLKKKLMKKMKSFVESQSETESENELEYREKRDFRVNSGPYNYNPKAPMNSTQYIMDDHDNNHELYTDFEVSSIKPVDIAVAPHPADIPYHSPAYEDINYEYESPDDVSDSFSFIEKDFEAAFQSVREDELWEMPKNKLVTGFIDLENKLLQLENRLESLEREQFEKEFMTSDSDSDSNLDESFEETVPISTLLEELHQLQNENQKLEAEHNSLKAV